MRYWLKCHLLGLTRRKGRTDNLRSLPMLGIPCCAALDRPPAGAQGTVQNPIPGELHWRDGLQHSYRSFLEENFIDNFCSWAKESLYESMVLHFKIKAWWCNHWCESWLQSPLVQLTGQVYAVARVYVQHRPEGQVLYAAQRSTAQTCSYSGQLWCDSMCSSSLVGITAVRSRLDGAACVVPPCSKGRVYLTALRWLLCLQVGSWPDHLWWFQCLLKGPDFLPVCTLLHGVCVLKQFFLDTGFVPLMG